MSNFKLYPLWRILRLPSVESGYWLDAGIWGIHVMSVTATVADVLEFKDMRCKQKLRHRMENGLEVDPIHILKGKYVPVWYDQVEVPDQLLNRLVLGNGHHRVKIAWELGIKALPYSDDIFDTGADWRGA